ncbi:MAG: molybdopterin-dependent oxidoreductase, partial [Pseudomonadota bacterium]
MPEPIHVAHRTCCFCEAVCGLRIEFRDGVPAHIRGDELDPSSRGYICPKGAAVARSDADPDRLRLPMARNRASGRHTEISWEEAFARVEEGFSRIDRRDPDSFALYYGTGIVHGAGYYYLPALAQAIPTQNIFSTSTVDQAPKQVACALMFGHPNSIPIPDIDRCNHLVIIGANPLQSNGSMMTAPGVANRLRRLRQRGGKIVVIDPLRTATAELADQYMPIKPATDVFLLAGMIHTLIEERLVRLGSLQEHVANLDQIAPAFSRFSPEVVSSVCGVPAAFIRTLAHETATRQAAAVYGRIGTTTQAFGTLASWMIDLVNILAGNLDQVGGMMFPKAAVGQYNSRIGRMRGSLEVFGPKTRVGGRPSINISRGFERPVVSLAEEIETAGAGQIRSLLTIGCNPVLTIPNGARVAKALDSLDFMVSVDPYINETTRFADVILPPEGDLAKQQYPSTYYQRSTRNVARWSPRSRPLAPHERSETEIYLRLASALRGDNAAPSLVDEHFIATLVEQWVLSAKGELPHLDGRKILEQLGDRSGIPRVID